MSKPVDLSGNPKPVVEPSSDDTLAGELTKRALHLRIRQQEILAELGVLALGRTSLLDLLDQTARPIPTASFTSKSMEFVSLPTAPFL